MISVPIHIGRTYRFARIFAAAAMTVFLLPAIALAQYTGPAPTKADSPNPNNKGRVLPAPDSVLPGNPIVLHPGDLIAVSVYGVAAYKVSSRIAGNGVVDLPLVGGMHLAGMTLQQAQQSVRDKLIKGGLILNPDVLINVQESTADLIGIMGEVNSPKAIQAFAPMSLLDVISSAGGLKPDASHSISILRKGSPQPLLVVLNSNPADATMQNIPLYPGDRVLVPRMGVVYVVGAVKRQGSFPISPDTPMTLLQAITLGGGINFEAAKGGTRIIRTDGATRREIKVDLGKVAAGKAPDPILQSDDIVMVPTNAIKAAIKGGGTGIAISLAYILVYLG